MAKRFFPSITSTNPLVPESQTNTTMFAWSKPFSSKSALRRERLVRDVPAQARSLTTSGLFDDTLKQWILAFQRWAVKNFGGGDNFKADGIIDPMPMATTIDVSLRFKSGRHSTLAFLCNRLWRYNRNAYLRIGDDYHMTWVPEGWSS